MTFWKLALQSLRYYGRSNLAIALGVAAATAVLTGALIVGDSMRHSLRSLTMERLGQIDELLVTDGFFGEHLAETIKQTDAFKANYSAAVPAIMFPGGTVEVHHDSGTRRAGSVTVLGITPRFWSLGNSAHLPSTTTKLGVAEVGVVINQTLADELQITQSSVDAQTAKLTLRIPKLNQLPGDSPLSKKNDLIESLVDLPVSRIIPTSGLGRFGLRPTQSDPLNIYVPIHRLQLSLSQTVLKHKSDPAQSNLIFLAGKNQTLPGETAGQDLQKQIRPMLEDYGLTLKRVTQKFRPNDDSGADRETVFDYWSLSTDRLVLEDQAAATIQAAFPDAQPVFTYLANDLKKADSESGIPFSMVSAIDFGTSFQPVDVSHVSPIATPADDEIVLNRWAAEDLEAAVGDTIVVTYFQPETTHGSQIEQTINLRLSAIAALTEPIKGITASRKGSNDGSNDGSMERAEFDQPPRITNDPDLTPEVPGVTDAESIENWDLPFETAGKLRPQDDDYWSNYRTTPKAFVALATGQRLWASRFGTITSFRIPVGSADGEKLRESIAAQLLNQIAQGSTKETGFGLKLVPIKRRGLEAAAGSTPFDVLFLALSMFVIASALILVSLLFRLAFEQRADQVGLLSAVGFSQPQIRRVWLMEMSIVSLLGAAVGIAIGMVYAAMMIWGLSTWWVGAISRPFLILTISPASLVVGFISGLLVCVATIAWALRGLNRRSVRGLLAGQTEAPPSESRGKGQGSRVQGQGQGQGQASRVESQGSRVQGSRVQGSRVQGQESRVQGQGQASRVESQGTRVGVEIPASGPRNVGVQPLGARQSSNSHPPRTIMAALKNQATSIASLLIVAAVGLSVMATRLSGEAQAGSFMGAGFLVLVALLMFVYRWLRRPSTAANVDSFSFRTLSFLNAQRNPLRSTLTIGLVAVASFLIAAVSAFRLAPTSQGTGGFDWVAHSSQPILEDLSTPEARTSTLGEDNRLSPGSIVMPLRYKAGEDASCNNLYQSTQPQVLGVPPALIEHFDEPENGTNFKGPKFAWAGSLATTEAERNNPWRLLNGQPSASDDSSNLDADAIPVVIDKNTANYSLKIYSLNSIFTVDYDSGETVKFRVIGFLSNSILQGSLIVAEKDFVRAFPTISGYQTFLIKDGAQADETAANSPSNVEILESRLGDYGFDARSAPKLLSGFMAVQNTYLSTFQTLGALGLLLGTFGLAAVQMRNVLERKRELGLMRAVGFSAARLRTMVLLENAFLLLVGLLVGIAAALFTTLPHGLIGNASIPWGELAIMFGVIAAVGIAAGSLASRQISNMNLLTLLRS